MISGLRGRELPELIWPAIMLCMVMRSSLTRWKASRRQKLAATWPHVAGRIRGASVRPVAGASRLTLTYNFVEKLYGNDLWWRDFPNKAYAEHAKRMLTDRTVDVHYNPEREDDTELLWSDLRAIVAQEPFVPRLQPFTRTGYGWATALTAISVIGLAASAGLYILALRGSVSCVCEVMLGLAAFSVFLLLAATPPWTRLTAMAPTTRLGRGTWWVLRGWQRVAMIVAVLAALVSFIHFGPLFRALPMSADVPEAVMAGTLGVLPIPVYLFCAIVGLETMLRRRPEPEHDAAESLAS